METRVVSNRLERMRAIIDQAVAEARGRVHKIYLLSYGDMADEQVLGLFVEASHNTPAEGVEAIVLHAGSRYICWNCCGLRFESDDGVCPNCGEVALEVPEDIDFALSKVEIG
jgi:Zn finger protein HypA/HybF involved in hydrogenase expression